MSILTGLAFVWIGSQVSHLSCVRQQSRVVDCRLDRRFLGSISTHRRELGQVTGATVQEDCFDDCRYWIELRTKEASVRLTPFSSYRRSRVAAELERIEELLGDPKLESFEHSSPPSWLLLACSLPLICAGGALTFLYGGRLFES